jgi:hypothetical protein
MEHIPKLSDILGIKSTGLLLGFVKTAKIFTSCLKIGGGKIFKGQDFGTGRL